MISTNPPALIKTMPLRPIGNRTFQYQIFTVPNIVAKVQNTIPKNKQKSINY